MRIAVIPARSGSKRIPRKNVKDFCGKPAFAWAIEKARASGLFDHIVVSTDDEEIAGMAIKFGAEAPFLRPDNLADDFTPTAPVVEHAIRSCMALGWVVEEVCCIYPCVPLMVVDDLTQALAVMNERNADFVFPVTDYSHPIHRAMRYLPDGSMEFIFPENELVRTQDAEKTYHDAGQFYWGQTAAWLNKGKIHTDGIGFLIPNWRVVDIDSIDDWKRAELIFKANFDL